jgi:hypothetical protein
VIGKPGGSSNLRLLAGNLKLSNGRLLNSGSGTPTIAAGGAMGGSPPAPAMGSGSTDVRGSVKFGTGTGPFVGLTLITVTFATPYPGGQIPTVTGLTPKNVATAQLAGGGTGGAGSPFFVSSVSTTGFVIGAAVALPASQAANTYEIGYVVTS